MIKSFRELEVWQKADGLAHRVFDATETFPRQYLFDLTSQLRRAALSVPTNLAEGCATTHTKELLQFINIVRRSVSEAQHLLLFALRRELISVEAHEQFHEGYEEVVRMLNGLSTSLGKHGRSTRRPAVLTRSLLSVLTFGVFFTGHWSLVTGHFPPVYAQVPALIRYQGQAVDSNGVPLEGPYDLMFRLYDAATGGTVEWEERHEDVALRGGHFSVLLGSMTALTSMTWDTPCWLAVQVNGEQELSPRQRVTSVPTAIAAERLADSHTISPVNLLKNGSFETWNEDPYGVASWTTYSTIGARAVLQRETERVVFGQAAARLLGDGVGHGGSVVQSVTDVEPLRGHTVTLSVWALASIPGVVYLGISDGIGGTNTGIRSLNTGGAHTGSGTWEQLSLSHRVNPKATDVTFMIGVDARDPGLPVIFVDGAIAVSGPMPFAFSPHPADARPDISVRVTHSRPIETLSDVDTALPFDTERWDTANLHEETTPTRLTAPASGKYYIFGNVEFSANGAGQRQAKLVVNGSNVIAGTTMPNTGVWQTWLNVSTYYELQAGDYVALYVHHTGTGGSLTVFKRSSVSPEFGMVKIE